MASETEIINRELHKHEETHATANLMPCCESWEVAHHRGTDNEAYGPLILGEESLQPYPLIGDLLPVVRFCPWCGAEKGKE